VSIYLVVETERREMNDLKICERCECYRIGAHELAYCVLIRAGETCDREEEEECSTDAQ